jgi:hypothetical protein
MPDNEIWCTGKSKKKDIKKKEDLEILGRNGKAGKLQEKPQLCIVASTRRFGGEHYTWGLMNFEEHRERNSGDHSTVISSALLK